MLDSSVEKNQNDQDVPSTSKCGQCEYESEGESDLEIIWRNVMPKELSVKYVIWSANQRRNQKTICAESL